MINIRKILGGIPKLLGKILDRKTKTKQQKISPTVIVNNGTININIHDGKD